MIQREDFDMLIHAALQKCCDSDITSIAYNVIHEISAPWGEFLVALWKDLDGDFSVDRARQSLQYLRDKPGGTTGYRAIVLLFFNFDDRDLEGALAYLQEEDPPEGD